MSLQGIGARAGFVTLTADDGTTTELPLTPEAFRYLENLRKRTLLISKDYPNDAAAEAAGVALGDEYHSSGAVKVRIV